MSHPPPSYDLVPDSSKIAEDEYYTRSSHKASTLASEVRQVPSNTSTLVTDQTSEHNSHATNRGAARRHRFGIHKPSNKVHQKQHAKSINAPVDESKRNPFASEADLQQEKHNDPEKWRRRRHRAYRIAGGAASVAFVAFLIIL